MGIRAAAFASIYSWLSVVVGRLALVLTENVTKLLLLPLCNFRMSSHLLTIETPIFFLQLWADYLFNEMLIYIGQFICENICLFKSHIKKSGQIFIVNMDSFVIRAAKPYLATIGATVHGHYGKILYKEIG